MAPRTSKHSTWQNKARLLITVPRAVSHASSQFYPAETTFQAAASIHAAPTVTPRHIPTEFYQEK